MRPRWEATNARARGLDTRRLRGPDLEALAREPDLPALAGALRRAGFVVAEDEAAVTAPALDLAVRRAAAAELRVLARWSDPSVLAVLFEDEDRRSVRAILRGGAQHAGPEARLAGLIPTPALPERALGELARQPTASAVAALLSAWRHPYGGALREEAARAAPDLLRMEVAVNRCFAMRALAGGRRAGRTSVLAHYVADVIDLENAGAALVLAGAGRDVPPAEMFLVGGRRLGLAAFARAAASPDAVTAARRLADAFAGSPFAEPFRRLGGDPGAIAAATLQAHLRVLTLEQRRAPLGPAPVLAYALRLRAQVIDLRRLIWRAALV